MEEMVRFLLSQGDLNMSQNEKEKIFRLVCAFDKLIETEKPYLDQCFSYNEIVEQMIFAGDTAWVLIENIKSAFRTERKKLVRLFGSELYIFDKVTTEKTIFVVVECSELDVLEQLDLLMFRSNSSLNTLLLSQEGEIDCFDYFPFDEYRAAFSNDFYASQVMKFGASYLASDISSKLEAMDDETFSTAHRY